MTEDITPQSDPGMHEVSVPDAASEMPNGVPPHREDTPANPKRRGTRLLLAIAIVSLCFGIIGGFIALVIDAHASQIGSFLMSRGSIYSRHQHSTVQKPVTYTPQDTSALSGGIVDVVQKASPAVVSITISQQESDIQNAESSNSANDFGINPGDGSDSGDGSGQCFSFILGFSNCAPASNNPSDNGAASGQDSPAADSYQEVAAGSGFFVSSDGLILTNKHVVSLPNARYTVTTTDGKTYDATVAAIDPINDLALMKISIQNAPTLSLSDSSTIVIGEQVIAIGNSLGQYQNTVTSGIVSGIGRNVTAGSEDAQSPAEELDGVIQTDAAINPGNSGGPLLNSAGQVIGVNTAVDQEGQLVGFAIPANFAAQDIASYESQGKIVKPFLGLSYISLDADSQKQYDLPVSNGAYVTASSGSPIVSGSAAEKAGLKGGDIITAINGTNIDATHTLSQLLQQFNPGDTITLTVIRGGKTLSLSVTLGSKS